MEKQLKALVISMMAVIVLLAVIVFNSDSNPLMGSVDRNSTYQSRNLTALTASTTVATSLKTTSGALGSVVFATTSAQTFTFYDVAAGANYASTTLSTSIVQFATGTPAGVYTFDLNVFRGLAVFSPVTSTKDIIVTYR